jgi:hypothetical protein
VTDSPLGSAVLGYVRRSWAVFPAPRDPGGDALPAKRLLGAGASNLLTRCGVHDATADDNAVRGVVGPDGSPTLA